LEIESTLYEIELGEREREGERERREGEKWMDG
jgi:hypothetical protein